MLKRIIILFLIFGLPGAGSLFARTLTVKVSNIRQITGNLMVGVFNSETGFPDVYFKGAKVKVTGSAMTVTFKDLPEGKYAVSAYHDANMNGALDKNIFGVPKEKYGFSNRDNKPDYKASLFDFNSDTTLNISLK
ncbi:MAG: DUF2141 domain-containing protein [Prevotellaceae bacterium]|jgi:uncharacterized protein (DUF2141 family)|nr:DUF2141 domain-containing protein [Prevotellaceae bacterium]